MNINEIAKLVSKKEGLKKSISIAQIKEVIGIVAELIVKDPIALASLLQLGAKRVKQD